MKQHRDSYTCIIVDDEEDAIQVLESLLKDYPEFDVCARCTDTDSALNAVIHHQPDLLFLDIQMPGSNGFHLLKEAARMNLKFSVIFCTAYNRFALDAIKVSALDYLLKPVNPKELQAALCKFKQNYAQGNLLDTLNTLLRQTSPKQKIRFNTRQGFIMIDPEEILYCEADWNYTEIWLGKSHKEVVTLNIGKVEECLPPGAFYRLSRSLLVNSQYIQKLNRKTRIITLQSGDDIVELKAVAKYLSQIK